MRTPSSNTATTAAVWAAPLQGHGRPADRAARDRRALGGASVTGEVTIELRRGSDYSIMNTESPNLPKG
jgi:hypothetical protein